MVLVSARPCSITRRWPWCAKDHHGLESRGDTGGRDISVVVDGKLAWILAVLCALHHNNTTVLKLPQACSASCYCQ